MLGLFSLFTSHFFSLSLSSDSCPSSYPSVFVSICVCSLHFLLPLPLFAFIPLFFSSYLMSVCPQSKLHINRSLNALCSAGHLNALWSICLAAKAAMPKQVSMDQNGCLCKGFLRTVEYADFPPFLQQKQQDRLYT